MLRASKASQSTPDSSATMKLSEASRERKRCNTASPVRGVGDARSAGSAIRTEKARPPASATMAARCSARARISSCSIDLPRQPATQKATPPSAR